MDSSPRMSCFQCQDFSSNPNHLRNGWRLRSGSYTRLCQPCFSMYEEGRFCETFHSNDDGWRKCESCDKLVHCGCIVSFNTHFLTDSGGIICMDCTRFNFILARNRSLSLEREIRAGEPYHEPSGKSLVESQYCPQTDLEMQQVSKNPKSAITPLFEKLFSANDVDIKLARLILPNRCAEAFLPDISGLSGLSIKIQDTEGSEWEFHYRYWLNSGIKTYVLEGMRDFMVSKNWQPGDTVIFYRAEPGSMVVIGLGKTSAEQQLQESSVHGCATKKLKRGIPTAG